MENLGMGFPSGSAVKNQPANVGDTAGAMGSIPGLSQAREFGGKVHTLNPLATSPLQWFPYRTMDQGIPTVCLVEAGQEGG